MKKFLSKKYIIAVISVIVVLLIVAGMYISNRGVVSKDVWDNLDIGMSINDVEKKAGKPKKIIDDNAEISEKVYDDYKKMSEMSYLVDDQGLKNRLKRLDEVYSASERGENVKEYIYTEKTNSGKREVEVYFIGGVAKYYNREK